jgi:hypothetical protein
VQKATADTMDPPNAPKRAANSQYTQPPDTP